MEPQNGEDESNMTGNAMPMYSVFWNRATGKITVRHDDKLGEHVTREAAEQWIVARINPLLAQGKSAKEAISIALRQDQALKILGSIHDVN